MHGASLLVLNLTLAKSPAFLLDAAARRAAVNRSSSLRRTFLHSKRGSSAAAHKPQPSKEA